MIDVLGVERNEWRREWIWQWRFLRLRSVRDKGKEVSTMVMGLISVNTHSAADSLLSPLFLPFKSFLGTLRLDMPNSSAIPNSRRPRKSSPNASAKLPLQNTTLSRRSVSDVTDPHT